MSAKYEYTELCQLSSKAGEAWTENTQNDSKSDKIEASMILNGAFGYTEVALVTNENGLKRKRSDSTAGSEAVDSQTVTKYHQDFNSAKLLDTNCTIKPQDTSTELPDCKIKSNDNKQEIKPLEKDQSFNLNIGDQDIDQVEDGVTVVEEIKDTVISVPHVPNNSVSNTIDLLAASVKQQIECENEKAVKKCKKRVASVEVMAATNYKRETHS